MYTNWKDYCEARLLRELASKGVSGRDVRFEHLPPFTDQDGVTLRPVIARYAPEGAAFWDDNKYGTAIICYPHEVEFPVDKQVDLG